MRRATAQDLSGSRPDFRHIRGWIFDLDNTLYHADSAIFAQIEARMTLFVAEHLKLEPEKARMIQKRYYREHGTTLSGLMRLHGTDPEAYLDYVHAIDLSALAPDEVLVAALRRLPGRRFVFTNGCRHHAARVLARIGMADVFDDVWDIRTIGFCPKPQDRAYDAVAGFAGPPRGCAMFDDLARNLVPAHERGMTTVWLDTGARWSGDGPEFPVASREQIDHETGNLTEFLQTIRIVNDQ